MGTCGIDIGSRTIKMVFLTKGSLSRWEVMDSGSYPLKTARRLLAQFPECPTMATGYGRHLLELENIPSVTEIKACARGARHFFPEAGSVIDIGGQDLKVIVLDKNGKTARFEMNDRCAAGTGKFLEIMAATLECSLQSFGAMALKGKESVRLNSMCTVFAESEVISLLNRNCPKEDIALALHTSVVKKISSMYSRLSGTAETIVLAGGGAYNTGLVALLEKSLKKRILVPDNPQIVVAAGAALLAAEQE
ncbi:MAG: 3-hydroxyacyl-ACP dehydratase [Chitinivibrionales bacterium]|nr:3-hydroxyacyl-ACP dehydratase [Chitinivibrionales bacterium]